MAISAEDWLKNYDINMIEFCADIKKICMQHSQDIVKCEQARYRTVSMA